eukprot:TRINITY_DN448_c0_g3_i2.p1 TRINITY_DN448_c0_g3~~TRINITY_DN448_c0_g3_i2.p1  ORF type:complete len:658 (+),score=208.98 TRINITY_DN448_c0_g3_i2:149-2122(+)
MSLTDLVDTRCFSCPPKRETQTAVSCSPERNHAKQDEELLKTPTDQGTVARCYSCPPVARELEFWSPAKCASNVATPDVPRHNADGKMLQQGHPDDADLMESRTTGTETQAQDLNTTGLSMVSDTRTLPGLVDDKEDSILTDAQAGGTVDTANVLAGVKTQGMMAEGYQGSKGLNAGAAAFVPAGLPQGDAAGLMNAPPALLPCPLPPSQTNQMAQPVHPHTYNAHNGHNGHMAMQQMNHGGDQPTIGHPNGHAMGQGHLHPDPDFAPYSCFAGNAFLTATTPEGARVLQRVIPMWPKHDVKALLEELSPHMGQLISDLSGNYILQRILEHQTPAIRSQFVMFLQGKMLELSMQPYSCRMVQRVMDVIDEQDCVALAHELDGHVPKCVQDQHGNHVVQKFIDLYPNHCAFIVRSFVGRVEEIATHSYGCRVVQRVLEKCRESEEIIKVLEDILFYVQRLSLDSYGNYVVQHVVRHGHPEYQYAITAKLAGQFATMSTHKFASNVMEKLLENIEGARQAVIDEMMLPAPQNESIPALIMAAMDPFGNYVIQKLADLGTEAQKKQIYEQLLRFFNLLSKSHHSKNLQQKVKSYANSNGTSVSGYVRGHKNNHSNHSSHHSNHHNGNNMNGNNGYGYQQQNMNHGGYHGHFQGKHWNAYG